MKLPAGYYKISVFEFVDAGPLECSQAVNLFHNFLEDVDGDLPGAWEYSWKQAKTNPLAEGAKRAFYKYPKKSINTQLFKVVPVKSGGNGATKHGKNYCQNNPFTVLHNDKIGKLQLPAGKYNIFLVNAKKGGETCSDADADFAHLLNYPQGPPAPWVMDAKTGTFWHGSTSGEGFRVKPRK
jgi:hypothetical protein